MSLGDFHIPSNVTDAWNLLVGTIAWIKENPAYATIATFVVSAGGWLVVKASSLARRVWQGRRDRLRLIKIRSHPHRHIATFFDLYEKAFEDEERFSSAEIVEWLRGKAKRHRLAYAVLLVRDRDTTLGIGIYIGGEEIPILFVPYMAVSEEALAKGLSTDTIAKLAGAVPRRKRSRSTIVFEFENPNQRGLTSKEENRRRARIRKVQQHCGAVGLTVVFPQMYYFSPPFHSDHGKAGRRQMVLGLILPQRQTNHLVRQEVLAVLKFLYLEVYTTCVSEHDPNGDSLLEEIRRSYEELERKIPERVLLSNTPMAPGRPSAKATSSRPPRPTTERMPP